MVEDDEAAAGLREVESAHETAPQQVVGSGETGLTCPDDHHRREHGPQSR